MRFKKWNIIRMLSFEKEIVGLMKEKNKERIYTVFKR